MNRETIHHIITILASLPGLAIAVSWSVAYPQYLNPWHPPKGPYGDMWKLLLPVGIGGVICLANGVLGLILALGEPEAGGRP